MRMAWIREHGAHAPGPNLRQTVADVPAVNQLLQHVMAGDYIRAHTGSSIGFSIDCSMTRRQ